MQEEIDKKRVLEKNLLDKCTLDAISEINKQMQKKLDERNLFKDILIDVESSHINKLVIKKKLKQDDKVYLDYNSFVNDRNAKSRFPLNTEVDNFLTKNEFKSEKDYKNKIKLKSKIQNLQSLDEQDKFQRDNNMKIDISKVVENEKILKKHFLINEMRDSLKNQVLVKKQQQTENLVFDKKYEDEMLRNIDDYKKEKELENQANKDKYSKYKIELKNQINDKYVEEKPAITLAERNYNKNIMIKLNNL